jgi:hypothetical protein
MRQQAAAQQGRGSGGVGRGSGGMGRGSSGTGRGINRAQVTGQVAGRVARGAQQIAKPVKDEEVAPPTIARVVVSQAQNINMLRVLLEDLAKGVLDLSLVVGEHARSITDIQSRLVAIEQELGVEIELEPTEAEDPEPIVDGSNDRDYDTGSYDDLDEQHDEHAEEVA